MNRHQPDVAKFINRYGEEKRIYVQKGAALRVRRDNLTPLLAMNKAAGKFIGQRVQELRTGKGWTLLQLVERAGMRGGKERMWGVENGIDGGVRIGTLYALAAALGVGVSDLLPSHEWVMREADTVLGPIENVHLTVAEIR